MAMPPRNNRKERSQMQDIPSSSSSSAADNFSPPPFDFPPGYKFVPTDEELLLHYLKPFLKTNKISPPSIPIHLVNIYESNPEQLSKRYEKGNLKEWFFITERTKVREGGKKQIRNDNHGGYWNTQSAAMKIEAGEGVVGYKTKLDYFTGKNAKSIWLMHEYWLDSNGVNERRVDHALCKMFLSPRGMKRKAEEEENEKKKMKMKEVGVEEEVDQSLDVAFQQPQQEPHNYAYPPEQPRQPLFCLVPLNWIQPEQQQFPFSSISDELSQTEMMSFQQQPLIQFPDDDSARYLADFNSLMDGFGESSNSTYFEESFSENYPR